LKLEDNKDTNLNTEKYHEFDKSEVKQQKNKSNSNQDIIPLNQFNEGVIEPETLIIDDKELNQDIKNPNYESNAEYNKIEFISESPTQPKTKSYNENIDNSNYTNDSPSAIKNINVKRDNMEFSDAAIKS
jgi:hypothetical protein